GFGRPLNSDGELFPVYDEPQVYIDPNVDAGVISNKAMQDTRRKSTRDYFVNHAMKVSRRNKFDVFENMKDTISGPPESRADNVMIPGSTCEARLANFLGKRLTPVESNCMATAVTRCVDKERLRVL